MRWIKRLTRSSAKPVTKAFDAPLKPAAPFFAVADIHGRFDLLDDVSRRMSETGEYDPVVYVGDYVDRGPDSAAVLRRLFEVQTSNPSQVICLGGNHEEMLLGFIDDPVRYHRLWLKNGGDETLRSFGVPPHNGATVAGILETRDRFLEALGSDLHNWLRNLPVSWRSGNVWVTHAGADPTVEMDRQDRHALIWGHSDFFKLAREDDQWVIHGHTIVPEVVVQNGRVSIDTGAYLTDKLGLVRIADTGVAVIP